MNKVIITFEKLVEIAKRFIPITMKESRVHGYNIKKDGCFEHMKFNFKFESARKMMDGVLGQTYRPIYRSRVKVVAAMPIMGGADKFTTDCAASKLFGIINETAVGGEPLCLRC